MFQLDLRFLNHFTIFIFRNIHITFNKYYRNLLWTVHLLVEEGSEAVEALED